LEEGKGNERDDLMLLKLKIPKRDMDSLVRAQRTLDRTMAKISKLAVDAAMKSGFEVLTEGEDVPILGDESSFGFLARPKGKPRSIGIIKVNRNGGIQYTPRDDYLRTFQEEMQREIEDERGVKVLYG
jgi:hypothetical protein